MAFAVTNNLYQQRMQAEGYADRLRTERRGQNIQAITSLIGAAGSIAGQYMSPAARQSRALSAYDKSSQEAMAANPDARPGTAAYDEMQSGLMAKVPIEYQPAVLSVINMRAQQQEQLADMRMKTALRTLFAGASEAQADGRVDPNNPNARNIETLNAIKAFNQTMISAARTGDPNAVLKAVNDRQVVLDSNPNLLPNLRGLVMGLKGQDRGTYLELVDSVDPSTVDAGVEKILHAPISALRDDTRTEVYWDANGLSKSQIPVVARAINRTAQGDADTTGADRAIAAAVPYLQSVEKGLRNKGASLPGGVGGTMDRVLTINQRIRSKSYGAQLTDSQSTQLSTGIAVESARIGASDEVMERITDRVMNYVTPVAGAPGSKPVAGFNGVDPTSLPQMISELAESMGASYNASGVKVMADPGAPRAFLLSLDNHLSEPGSGFSDAAGLTARLAKEANWFRDERPKMVAVVSSFARANKITDPAKVAELTQGMVDISAAKSGLASGAVKDKYVQAMYNATGIPVETINTLVAGAELNPTAQTDGKTISGKKLAAENGRDYATLPAESKGAYDNLAGLTQVLETHEALAGDTRKPLTPSDIAARRGYIKTAIIPIAQVKLPTVADEGKRVTLDQAQATLSILNTPLARERMTPDDQKIVADYTRKVEAAVSARDKNVTQSYKSMDDAIEAGVSASGAIGDDEKQSVRRVIRGQLGLETGPLGASKQAAERLMLYPEDIGPRIGRFLTDKTKSEALREVSFKINGVSLNAVEVAGSVEELERLADVDRGFNRAGVDVVLDGKRVTDATQKQALGHALENRLTQLALQKGLAVYDPNTRRLKAVPEQVAIRRSAKVVDLEPLVMTRAGGDSFHLGSQTGLSDYYADLVGMNPLEAANQRGLYTKHRDLFDKIDAAQAEVNRINDAMGDADTAPLARFFGTSDPAELVKRVSLAQIMVNGDLASADPRTAGALRTIAAKTEGQLQGIEARGQMQMRINEHSLKLRAHEKALDREVRVQLAAMGAAGNELKVALANGVALTPEQVALQKQIYERATQTVGPAPRAPAQ